MEVELNGRSSKKPEEQVQCCADVSTLVALGAVAHDMGAAVTYGEGQICEAALHSFTRKPPAPGSQSNTNTAGGRLQVRLLPSPPLRARAVGISISTLVDRKRV